MVCRFNILNLRINEIFIMIQDGYVLCCGFNYVGVQNFEHFRVVSKKGNTELYHMERKEKVFCYNFI